MGSRMGVSRLIGALFLAAFLLYGSGTALVTSVLGASDFLSTISVHQTTLAFGAFLMLMNCAAVVGLGVLFFPVVEAHGLRTALVYLAARILEAVFLAVGVVGLLMAVPLGERAVRTGQVGAAWVSVIAPLAAQLNTMSYQIAEMSLAFASLFLCALLFRVRLIPRFLAAAGFVGYAIFLTGTIAEVFGIHIGLILSIPGGLFEVALGLWLLIRGFDPEVYVQES